MKKKNKAIVKAIKDGVPHIVRFAGEPVAIALPWEIWVSLNERLATARHEPKIVPQITEEMIATSEPTMLQHMQKSILDAYLEQDLAKEQAAIAGFQPVQADDLTGWHDALSLRDDEKDDFTQWFQNKRDSNPEFPATGQATQ